MEKGFVCNRACWHEVGDRLPWPPELPGRENWATGDVPTLLAYVEAIGSRLLALEATVSELSSTVTSLRRDAQATHERELPALEEKIDGVRRVLGMGDLGGTDSKRLSALEFSVRRLDDRTVGSRKIGG